MNLKEFIHVNPSSKVYEVWNGIYTSHVLDGHFPYLIQFSKGFPYITYSLHRFVLQKDSLLLSANTEIIILWRTDFPSSFLSLLPSAVFPCWKVTSHCPPTQNRHHVRWIKQDLPYQSMLTSFVCIMHPCALKCLVLDFSLSVIFLSIKLFRDNPYKRQTDWKTNSIKTAYCTTVRLPSTNPL